MARRKAQIGCQDKKRILSPEKAIQMQFQLGADVKVLGPKDLAKEVREEAGRMKRVYGVGKARRA